MIAAFSSLMQEAELSLGVEVDPAMLLSCLDELENFAAGWQRRAKLVWPYGGGRVEVSGEAVGGWEHKVPLAFDVQKRHWVAWLWVSGLPGSTNREGGCTCWG